jgi:regulator of chromosome condensation
VPRSARRRQLFALAGALASLAGLQGCSAADRAVLAAPGCAEGTASPRPVSVGPGTVHTWLPHFAAAGTPPRPPTAGEPVAVPGWDDVVSVASTGHTTAVVHDDGTVSAYGLGHRGSLGDGDPQRHHTPTPQPVPGITDARSVHAVGQAFFVVRTDGTVLGWGDGFLARGGVRDGERGEPSPIPVQGLTDVVAVSEGDLAAIALLGDGTVAGWGVNLTAVLGDRDRTDVTVVDDVRGVTSVAAAGGAVVAVTASGQVCAWGNNAHGLLGVEPTGGQTGRPIGLAAPTGVVQVAGGHDVAFALDGAGAVRAWGRGVHGVLGDGDVADHVSAVPRVVPGLPPARLIGAYGLTGYAVDVDGGLWAWGSGLPLGELSGGAAAVRPVRIPMPGPVLAVSGTHALVG